MINHSRIAIRYAVCHILKVFQDDASTAYTEWNAGRPAETFAIALLCFSMSILNENERKKDKLIPNSWPREIGVII